MNAPLEVWAPRAERVDVVIDDEPHPLTPTAEGWWRWAAGVPAGTDYAFSLDGGSARPDPRSPWQPHGVHGVSRTFDVRAHRWSDGDWPGRDVRDAVLYELHVGTFTAGGTLDDAAERLEHLARLGVTMIELMPVAAFNGRHGWGYDGVALYAVHEEYGGPAALQRFVDAAHRAGIAVCLDVVYNHLGPSGNYLAEFGPYFTQAHSTPWGAAVNLDGAGSAEVRAFVVENALRWLRDFHVDALRLDAVHALVDDSPVHLLAELSARVAALAVELDRPLSLVAESDLNDARMVTPVVDGGLGMTAQWDDDVHHALHALLTGERHGYYVDFGASSTFRKAVEDVFVHDGAYSTFRGRAWGAPVPADVDGHRFVAFSANHDQVGNRALGDRPGRTLDAAALAAAAALVLWSPFVPMLFMGEEWGASTPWLYFTDHPEAELGAAVTAGRAREFGTHGWADLYGDGTLTVPDPQDPATFAASRLDWAEPGHGEHARLLAWHRDVIALRAATPDLASGDRSATRVEHADDGAWLVLYRGSHAVVVARTDSPASVPVAGAGELVLAWDPPSTVVSSDAVALPGRGTALVRRSGHR
ncbi:malto-oligosyltrehalose trehalohydrolase [Beutenbergia cavernae DSM 12333]|uniref:Malto-oligosyltrehalose trehalohydrolase n=1 Tax=Beutenbergia cavernae (strain ATCC BAA-8 / DSM 12333 / CCUG 43141 / JCM 11478 / NBRC 16432 / NCIMB 13614 / HKI 0122) TaxID=471853 RepID=C5C5N5_BEUC1|nr:malto-oligosyltrehalose trehalohydrolase [Beutenbergia cavernae]ACQ80226.1 malto-oligosyltrehalose trehalohydrolase [Beutenbergia cavernae DSM 12333]